MGWIFCITVAVSIWRYVYTAVFQFEIEPVRSYSHKCIAFHFPQSVLDLFNEATLTAVAVHYLCKQVQAMQLWEGVSRELQLNIVLQNVWETQGWLKLASLPGRRRGAAPFRINCQGSLILCLNHHIAATCLNYCIISCDPVFITGTSGNAALLFFVQEGKKSKLLHGSFTVNCGANLSPCEFVGEIIWEVK